MKGDTFKKLLAKPNAYLKCNSATILTCLGAVGVVVTVVTAVKATPKAITLMEEAKEEKGEELTKVEAVKAAGPAYIPTIVMGAATVTCIFGANVLNKQKQASIMSAYALLDNYHKAYRGKLIEIHGEEADKEIRSAIARSRCDFHQIDLDTPDGKFIFYDEISGESFVRYEREVMDAEYHLNRNFALRGYASLNEFYEFLGLPKTDFGEEMGWSCSDGYSWIDFEHTLITKDDGGPDIYAINAIFPPDTEYLREWG